MIRTPSSIAQDIRKLAKGESPGAVALNALADKVERSHADLAGADLAAAYPPEKLLPEGPRSLMWLLSVLELTRDVLVFVPVAYTWWKIADALKAFAGSATKEPFLLAWQQGMGGATEPLSDSATFVAEIVAGIIALTVFCHAARGAYEEFFLRRRQRKLAALIAEVTLAATGTLMAGGPGASRVELAQIGTKIADASAALRTSLDQASSDIVGAVDSNPGSKLHEMFTQWTDAANELKELGTRLQGTQEVVVELRETQKALTTMSKSLTDETEKLLKSLRDEREASRHEAHVHHQLADDVRQSTELLRLSIGEMSERAEQFNNMVVQLQHLVNRLDPDGYQTGYSGGISR